MSRKGDAKGICNDDYDDDDYDDDDDDEYDEDDSMGRPQASFEMRHTRPAGSNAAATTNMSTLLDKAAAAVAPPTLASPTATASAPLPSAAATVSKAERVNIASKELEAAGFHVTAMSPDDVLRLHRVQQQSQEKRTIALRTLDDLRDAEAAAWELLRAGRTTAVDDAAAADAPGMSKTDGASGDSVPSSSHSDEPRDIAGPRLLVHDARGSMTIVLDGRRHVVAIDLPLGFPDDYPYVSTDSSDWWVNNAVAFVEHVMQVSSVSPPEQLLRCIVLYLLNVRQPTADALRAVKAAMWTAGIDAWKQLTSGEDASDAAVGGSMETVGQNTCGGRAACPASHEISRADFEERLDGMGCVGRWNKNCFLSS